MATQQQTQPTPRSKQQTVDLNSPYTRRMAQQAVLIDAAISNVNNEYMFGRLAHKESMEIQRRADVLCDFFHTEVSKIGKGIKNTVKGRSKTSEKRLIIVNTPYTGKLAQTTKNLDTLMRNIDNAFGYGRLDQNKEIVLRRKVNSVCEHIEEEIKAIRRLSNNKRKHSKGASYTAKPGNTVNQKPTNQITSSAKKSSNKPDDTSGIKIADTKNKIPKKKTAKKKAAKKKVVAKKATTEKKALLKK